MMRDTFFLPVRRIKRFWVISLPLLFILIVVASTIGKEHILIFKLFDLWKGEADAVSSWLFWELWLPRALLATGVGMALALSGNVFQLLTKNPLGSPDIIGVNAGASAGAVLSAIVFPSFISMTTGALLGALIVVILVVVANGRQLSFQFEAIVCGIAMNALALSIVQFGLTGLRQENALLLAAWLSGSLSGRGWNDVGMIWLGLPIVLIGLYCINRSFTLLSLHGDVAATLGVPIRFTMLSSLLLATILSALAVLVAGPISFIALCAPHIVRKMLKTHQTVWLANAVVGAILLLLSDIVARLLPVKAHFPVGVLTAGLGGLYLLWLLIAEMRKNSF
ncbi:FecCD family ABC transporter permease [Pelistega europaea]|uniref:Iron chelate uptake ABC transporter family permease subunit n=1 Tax=Pelistega europaea TaxID=106147 RepID=A0A7Y4L9V1_9BURK|nr:iron chelate uptake ABC transporter family permease subunit [Pelistega europaea]NOL49584.1 iron chelate uptake ABC transporter family permease subunit [Pelistega europaea]